MDFLKSFGHSEKSLRKKDIQKEINERQRKTYTRWINDVLEKVNSEKRVQNLYDDLKDGIILADIIYAFTFKKLKLNVPKNNSKGVISSNLSIVLDALKDEGIYLVNINGSDIMEGKPKIVLGLVWKMILHYYIGRNVMHHQELSLSDCDKSFSSLDSGSITSFESNNASPRITRKFKNAVLSPFHNKKKEMKKKIVERNQLNNIIKAWLKKEIFMPNGIEINNFNKDWADGVAFMALVHKFLPKLVDMDAVKKSPPKKNITEAFELAERYLGIKQLLDVDDVIYSPPEESSVLMYVSQFMKNDLKPIYEDDEMSEDIKSVEDTETYQSQESLGSVRNVEKIIDENLLDGSIDDSLILDKQINVGGPLSTVSEESCEDMSMESLNDIKRMYNSKENIFRENCETYQLECAREPANTSLLSSITNDSVFERINEEVKKDVLVERENNDANIDSLDIEKDPPSDDIFVESYDRGLENIYSSIFGDGISEENRENTIADCNEESATKYVNYFSSSLGPSFEVDVKNMSDVDSSSDSSSDECEVIECCIDDMSPTEKNKSFFDESNESEMSSETIIESNQMINMEVVDIVNHLVDVVVDKEDEEKAVKCIDDIVFNNDSDIVYETDEDDMPLEESNDLEILNKSNIIPVESLADVMVTSNDNKSLGEGWEEVECLDESFKGTGTSPLVSLLLSPLGKLYEMMNDSGPGDDYVDTLNEQHTNKIPVGEEVIVEEHRHEDFEDDNLTEHILDDVESIKSLTEMIASDINHACGYEENESESVDGSDILDIALTKQIEELANVVNEMSEAIDSAYKDKENLCDKKDIDSLNDTETPEYIHSDASSTATSNSSGSSNECVDEKGIIDTIMSYDPIENVAELRFRKHGDIIKEENLVNESLHIKVGESCIEKSEGRKKSKNNVSFTPYLILIVILTILISTLAYLTFDCSTGCSNNCSGRPPLIGCLSIKLHLRRLRDHVPF
uniref:Calponin-homology (CH) domain-containing protein n=1 Tax=Parastrongyloides trichosuri TaxID=131310 RepID=A0A0N4Z7F1_PARTI